MNKILVIDIETAGNSKKLNIEEDSIVEIGVVQLDLDSGKIESKFSEIIYPQGKISKKSWVFNNTSLKFNDVMNGKTIDEIYSELQNLFNIYYCTAYNKDFDFSFLRRNDFIINKELNDVMIYATKVLKIPSFYGYKWPKVQECLDFLEIHDVEPHRALDDATLEARIIYRFYVEYGFDPFIR